MTDVAAPTPTPTVAPPVADAPKADAAAAPATEAPAGDAPKAEGDKLPEVKLPDIPAGRLAALDKKQRQFEATKREVEAARAEVDQKLATLKERQAFAEEFKANPQKALADMGVDVDATMLAWFKSQEPKTPDQEIEARDKEIARLKKLHDDREAAEKKAQLEKARSESVAKTYADAAAAITAAPAEQADLVQALTKAGEVIRTAKYPDGISTEKLIAEAAAEEWIAAGKPQLTDAQVKKLFAQTVADLNGVLASKPDVVAKYRATTPVVESPPKSPAELGRGEAPRIQKKPTTKAELNA